MRLKKAEGEGKLDFLLSKGLIQGEKRLENGFHLAWVWDVRCCNSEQSIP